VTEANEPNFPRCRRKSLRRNKWSQDLSTPNPAAYGDLANSAPAGVTPVSNNGWPRAGWMAPGRDGPGQAAAIQMRREAIRAHP
jgi:hypothetical protein